MQMHIRREKGRMKIEADVEVMHLQVKKHQGLPADTGKEDSSLEPLEGTHPC